MIRCAGSSSHFLKKLERQCISSHWTQVNRRSVSLARRGNFYDSPSENAGVKFQRSEALDRSSIPFVNGSYRNASVFSSWRKEWHNPDFLSSSSVREKEDWLETLLKDNAKSVDVEAYLVVLNALAATENQKDAGAPRRAEQWMNRLRNHSGLQPSSECYQAVIQSWANSSKEQVMVVVNRAERWLNELVEESEAHPERIQPTIHCFNAYLDACTRGRSGRNKRNNDIIEQNAQKADAIFRRLHSHYHHMGGDTAVAPNTDTFNYVIRGWTRCKQDEIIAKKVLSLVRLMETYQRGDPLRSSVRPNTKSYAMAMDALVSVGKLKASQCLKGGKFITDPSRNGIKELEEALAVLDYMHELHAAGVEGVVPHRIPYNILITGWAGLAGFKHHKAPFKAEEIIRKMLALKDDGFTEAGPDRVSFEKVMLAWANSGHPNAGKRCTWWLKKLWNDSELEADAGLLPTKHTYNIAMKALASSDDALATENLLLDLGDKYREEKVDDLCPNSESFSIVIRSWLRKAGNDTDKREKIQSLKRAVEWLSSLREVENENNLSTSPELFLGVLRIASKCARKRRDILDLSTNTFDELKTSRHRVDHVSYSLFLKVGLEALSSHDDRVELSMFVRDLFSDCAEDGLISNLLIRELQNFPAFEQGWNIDEFEEFVAELLPKWPLPHSWTRNLPNAKSSPKPDDLNGNFDLYSKVANN